MNRSAIPYNFAFEGKDIWTQVPPSRKTGPMRLTRQREDIFQEMGESQISALVTRASHSIGSNGKSFSTISAIDGNREYEIRIWNAGEHDGLPMPDRVYDIELKRAVQCDVPYESDNWNELPDADPAEFLLLSRPIPEMEQWIRERVAAMRAPLSSISFALLERYGEPYRRNAAGKSMHHAYPGGLITHSHTMARVAEMLSTIYPIDADMAVCGCLFHDIGKTVTLETRWSGASTYTLREQLEGHLLAGCSIVRRVASDIGVATDDIDLLHLVHIIASHHENREHGAICEPATAEALLVAKLDCMDMEQDLFTTLPENFSGFTSDTIPALGRRIAVI